MHARPSRPYRFLGQTTSLCEVCLDLVPAKIIAEDDRVYYQKRCAHHGVQKTLVSTDLAYWQRTREWVKAGDVPRHFASRTERGCPWDCGICPDHEQHTCLALIEVNEHCNLTCPVCFAGSSPAHTGTRTLAEIERMLDALVEAEGEPDLVPISGGEPTLHPQILEILRLAKSKPIRHVMLNTNGIRIAREPEFVRELAALRPGIEVYLQFDSLQRAALENIRGADLTRIRRQALDNLEAAGVSTTLVVVVKKGVNDGEIGAIIEHALGYRCVRGITFQPVQDAGRNDGFDKNASRVVLTDIRSAILAQSARFAPDDIVPLPCDAENIAIAYALRDGRKLVPVTGAIPRDILVRESPNAIAFEKYPELRRRVLETLSLSATGEGASAVLGNLLCCLPGFELPASFGYENVFRIVIVQFLDKYNFCIGQVKRSCIHFVTPDGRIIPFDTYNLFYRAGTDPRIGAGLARAPGPAP